MSFYDHPTSKHVVEPPTPAAQPSSAAQPAPAAQGNVKDQSSAAPPAVPPAAQPAPQTGPKPFYANSDHTQPKAQTDTKPAQPKPAPARASEAPAEKPKQHDPLGEHVPEAVRELRASDEARKLFPEQAQTAYKGAIRDDMFAALEAPGVTPEVKARAVAELREMASDVGVTPEEAQQFVSLYKQASQNPPTPEQRAEWNTQAAKRLVELHGLEGANRALQDAQKLVQRDPRLAKMLEASKLGDHPQVVEMLVGRAIAARAKGRLK